MVRVCVRREQGGRKRKNSDFNGSEKKVKVDRSSSCRVVSCPVVCDSRQKSLEENKDLHCSLRINRDSASKSHLG